MHTGSRQLSVCVWGSLSQKDLAQRVAHEKIADTPDSGPRTYTGTPLMHMGRKAKKCIWELPVCIMKLCAHRNINMYTIPVAEEVELLCSNNLVGLSLQYIATGHRSLPPNAAATAGYWWR